MTRPRDEWRYANPPVIETVLGVAFEPLPGWGAGHFGLYWASIRGDYPNCKVQPPLPSPSAPVDELTLFPGFVRCWFVNNDETGLLQVQRDRFIRNWKKQEGSGGYPHYETTRPLFEQDWVNFTAFLAQEGLGPPKVSECEVTYVNHIPREAGAFSEVFVGWSGEEVQGTETTGLAVRYPMPEEKGVVSLQVQPAARGDQKPVYQYVITAKGRPASSSLADIVAWFDRGRQSVRRAFKGFTTPRMHKLWGEKEP